jgi:hypothetical protein
VRSARDHEPKLDQGGVLRLVAENSGLPLSLVEIAVGYWSSYPAEIDSEIDSAEMAEEVAEQAWQRRQELLARR